MTTTDLFRKFMLKKAGIQNGLLNHLLADIMRKINPRKQEVRTRGS